MTSIVTDPFPPMSINESKIVMSWLNEFRCVTNPPAGQTISMIDRLNKFDFTKVDGSIYKNPFVELVCLIFITNIASEKDDENEKTRVHNILLNKWNKLLNYLNLNIKNVPTSGLEPESAR